MSYYNRPILVKNALQAILRANEYHQDWELLFGDDSSKIPGRPIVEDILRGHLHKVTFAHSNMSLEDKIRDGLPAGRYCNEAIKASNADVAIMYCDDDQLHPMYLKSLSDFFDNNPEILYCYSFIHIFNPLMQKVEELENNVVRNKYNKWSGAINPANKVDASQVAWRLKCCKEYGAWFMESTKLTSDKPWVQDTDKSFFHNLYKHCGECRPSGLLAQYKGIHDYQLLWHKNIDHNGLRNYVKLIDELGGVLF